MNRALVIAAALAACGTPKSTTPPDHAVGFDTTKPEPKAPTEKPMTDPKPGIPMQVAQPQELVFPEEDFRKKQPEATELRPFKFPAVKPFVLASGIQVYLVEQHALPIVTMQLEIDGGGLADPKGKDGLASVCMAMLTEGTEQLDKLQYAEALANIASSINAGAGDDTLSISLSSLTKHLDATFDLFVATLRTPGLRASDFDRMIKRRLESLKQARSSPAQIPNRVSDPILYGRAHPRGGVVTEASYQAIALADCKAFLTAHVKPQHARLFVVGDMTEADIKARFATKALAGWTGAAPKLPAEPKPKTMAGRIFFVDVPGSVQSQVWTLAFGPKRVAPEYFQNSILGSVFGGGFASRINMNLREDKGYSYGARGGFNYSRTGGTFVASTQVRADATYQTLLEIDRELKSLATGKVAATAAEIDREKIGVTLALPGRFATAQSALAQYRGLVYFGLPLDYYDTYVSKVSKVTPALVKHAAATALDPAHAVYLVVGDGSTKMVVHDPDAPKDAPIEKRNPPYLKDGKPVTLREALIDLAARGDVGAGGFVELDADAQIVKH